MPSSFTIAVAASLGQGHALVNLRPYSPARKRSRAQIHSLQAMESKRERSVPRTPSLVTCERLRFGDAPRIYSTMSRFIVFVGIVTFSDKNSRLKM